MTKNLQKITWKDKISPEMIGWWRVQGYGLILEITDEDMMEYEVTQISCIPTNFFREHLPLPNLKIILESDNLLFIELKDFTYQFKADRLNTKPLECDLMETLPNPDPIRNFEVFWHTFNEQYGFFNERGIDWQQIYKKFRPKISPDTTPEELFEILSEIVHPFKDGHIRLSNGVDNFQNVDSFPEWMDVPRALGTYGKMQMLAQENPSQLSEISMLFESEGFPAYYSVIKDKYLHKEFQHAVNGVFLYGKITPDIGYIEVQREAMYIPPNGGIENIAEGLCFLHAELDRLADYFQGTKAIIHDLRFNFGGHDGYSRAIAERYADCKRKAFSRCPRNGDAYTEEWPYFVDPIGKKVINTTRVIVLTSEFTVSSGEVQTLALKAMPHVTTIGEPTKGCLSDTLEKALPNGWGLTLSNQRFYSHDHTLYEAIKIQPDYSVSMSRSDAERGKDPMIEFALDLLKNNG